MAATDVICDGLATVIKQQGDLIRSLKLNSAPKEQVCDMLHLNMQPYTCGTCVPRVRGDAILEAWPESRLM